MNSNKNYTLEIKRDDENFDEFDPNEITLNIFKWDEQFSLIDEKDFNYSILRTNRYEKMQKLEEKILDFYKLSNNQDILLFRKIEMSKTNYNIVIINNNENKLEDKDISECGLYDSAKIYMEIKDENWKESNFIRIFNEKAPTIAVHFNLPLDSTITKNKLTMNSYKFENEIEIKKNQTIRDLKTRIGEILKLSNKEFIMRKFSHNGQEIKSSNDSIEKLNTNSINIFIDLGMSLGEGKSFDLFR